MKATTIIINPGQLRSAARRLGMGADDLLTAAGAIASFELPPMPPAMAAHYATEIGAIAARMRARADDYIALADELRLRAAAAQVAGDVGATAAPVRIVVALGGARGGAGADPERTVVATLGIDEEGGHLRTDSGITLDMPELAVPEHPADVPAPAAPAEAPAVAAGEPIAGAPAQGVAGAVAAPAVHDAIDAAGGYEHDASGTADGGRAGASDSDSTPLRAHEQADGPLLAHDEPPQQAAEQNWACWMASGGAHHGVPPALPVMLALANSGMRNVGDDNAAGFFGLDTQSTNAPPGFGQPRDAQPDGQWWAEHPKAQIHDVLARLDNTSGGSRSVSLDDPDALARWAHDVQPAVDPAEYAAAHAAAQTMVDDCARGDVTAAAGAGGGAGGGGALGIAQSQLGVRETGGANVGPEVDEYLGAAQVAPGNPWCASFVTWSLEQSGHQMPGGGWAAVSTWVGAAQAELHGLSIVSPEQARPGDIVAYDWGGGGDFGADGHIGFLDSQVSGDGAFTTVEGNSGDAVSRMSRQLGEANTVFIRVGS